MTDVQETTTATEEPQVTDSTDEGLEDIKTKILHILDHTQFLTRGMIQIALSPALPPKLWDPILRQLVESAEILEIEVQTKSPSGRAQTKVIYHLPKYPYPPATVDTAEVEV